MQKIDSHQHFWHYHPSTHGWINDQMSELKQDFLPPDLATELKANNVLGCVAVQASQTLQETEWLLSLADQHSFILGIVGWVNLKSADLPNSLERLAQNPNLKGIRHVIQDEPDDDFMLDPDFIRGVNQLPKHGLTYDLLIFERHLPVALDFLNQLHDVKVVVDHIAKPKIAQAELQPWQKNIAALARKSSSYCKISGMVTEADWQHWRYDNLVPYLDTIVEAFGPDRLMIGSDWPVCLLAAKYERIMEIVDRYFEEFSENEREQIFFKNAREFYRLSLPSN
ncbi:MAG: amidohydrolase family protein [Bacteroidota bacterium]